MEIIILSAAELMVIFAFAVLGFFMAMILTPVLTHFLYKYKVWKKQKTVAITGEKLEYYSELHREKHLRHMPTMAGVLIWGAAGLITLGFNLSRAETYLPLFAIIAFGIFGLIDDLINLSNKSKIAGMGFKFKLFVTCLLAALGAWWFYSKLGWNTIHIPGGNLVGLPYNIEIGWVYIPIFILVIVSSANAVNLTDGLDGLAGGLSALVFTAFAIIAMVSGKTSLAAFCATLVGVLLSYTWYNIPPARFYMGDTGSLALGATMGVIAMLTNNALVLPIIAFVFVWEALSSLIQIFSKKAFGKKVFLSSPYHHHLEAIGWPETKVVMRFWVIGAVFAILGLFIALLGKGN